MEDRYIYYVLVNGRWVCFTECLSLECMYVLVSVGQWKVCMLYCMLVFGRWVCLTACNAKEGVNVKPGVGLYKAGMFYWV